jgi:hypothetical protein
MSEITYKLTGMQELRAIIRQLKRKIVTETKDILNVNSARLITYVRENKLVDKTTSHTLASRSMQLKRSLRVIPAKVSGEFSVESGMSVGTPYAKTHFGDKGSSFTVYPRNKKFLTVPLPAALDGRGSVKAGARDPMWGSTFIAKGIIFGYKGAAAVAGKAREIVPLFVLKKSVTVQRRIFPSQLFAKIKPDIEKDFKEALPKWALA